MKNSWTGGQYSLFRVLFATYLLAHFLFLLPRVREGSSMTGLLSVGAVLSVFFGIGLYDRLAALGLGLVWTCLFGRDPLLANPSILFIGGLLLAHVLLPPAPYGSWAARGRADPGGGWRMPPALFAAAWIVLALSYTYSGYTKLVSPSWRDGTALSRMLDNPLVRPGWLRETLLALPPGLLHLGAWIMLALELAFAPLALLPHLRPWLWGMMFLMHLPLLAWIDFTGLVMLHLFTWDPGWVRPLPGGTERLFYDGHCGLCQRSVRLILAEDATGTAFRFAPLQGETFAALLPAPERAALPLSLVVRTEKGTLLTRSSAVLHILRRLGGTWRLLAGVLVFLPAVVRDRLYDGIARIRHRLFAQPAETCPLMPPSLRTRFDP
jgi:predicted DCC family thiol-disulfide oxidoreductase YuxK